MDFGTTYGFMPKMNGKEDVMPKTGYNEEQKMRVLFKDYLDTLNNKDFDEWYCTRRQVSQEVFKDFFKWLKKHNQRMIAKQLKAVPAHMRYPIDGKKEE